MRLFEIRTDRITRMRPTMRLFEIRTDRITRIETYNEIV